MRHPKHHDAWHYHHCGDPGDEAPQADPAVEISPAPTAHHLSVVIGGEAIAIGHDTSAVGFVDTVMEDLGNCTVAFGVAIVGATSHNSADDAPEAVAQTFVHVTGADCSIEINYNERGVEGASAWAVSETEYVAVEAHGASSRSLDAREAFAIAAQLKTALAFGAFGIAHGNTADVFATADAHGTDTFVTTLTHALTVENHFSSVSGFAGIAS
jgi:hypothetical protein